MRKRLRISYLSGFALICTFDFQSFCASDSDMFISSESPNNLSTKWLQLTPFLSTRLCNRAPFINKYFALDKIDTITPKILSNNFAIKEAFSKSLGLGFRAPCFPKDISVQRDKMGKPEIFPKNKLKEYMKEKFGNFLIHVSLSDTNKYSIASVIIEKT